MATAVQSGAKFILLIPDGMADQPIPALQGRTPLEHAKTPHMDRLARAGQVGWARTVPDGMPPGSDVACMSLFGYDPKTYHTGRAPLEAASQNIQLGDKDVVFRCNFVTVNDDTLKDYSADHIATEESRALIATLNDRLGSREFTFHAGVSYRNLLVATGRAGEDIRCTPPHDLIGKPVRWPEGEDAAWVTELMRKSADALREHPVNAKRRQAGKGEATMVWLWGQGTRPTMPTFRSRFGMDGSVISAVDLVRGLGRLAGLEVLNVPGATGYFDTNYRGKAEYALQALEQRPFVVVHVEATDEAGHVGNLEEKLKAIEAVDQLVLGTLLDGLEQRRWQYRLLISPDHPTFIATRTHVDDPVPYVIYSSAESQSSGASGYNERAVAAMTPVERAIPGHTLMDHLMHERIPTS